MKSSLNHQLQNSFLSSKNLKIQESDDDENDESEFDEQRPLNEEPNEDSLDSLLPKS